MGQGKEQEEWLRKFAHIDVKVQEYEEIKKSDRVDSAGCASYIERNELMIDDSDYCVFFVQERRGKKSGSLIAFDYANRKQKEILNIYVHNT